jgi:acetyl-CoA carboxylase carboxyltransferase component
MSALALVAEDRALSPELLTPLERIERLCDPRSVRCFRSTVTGTGRRSTPGDGVVAAAGTRGGRPLFAYAQDAAFVGGSLGAAHGESIARVLRMAGDCGAPVVGFIESAGARVDEGAAALAGYGAIFREQVRISGRCPQIAVVTGVSAGGGAYSPALADFVVMTDAGRLFLTGPGVVREVMGEDVGIDDLGGPAVHARNGVCHLSADSDDQAITLAGELVDHLAPDSATASAEPRRDDIHALAPANPRKVYDVRDVIACLADRSQTIEIAPRFAPNLVTSIGRMDGRSVGFVANQPRRTGGVLDADSAQKAARFVRTCDAFGLPLVVLVDTPGFMPGLRQERGAVLRHGAKLLHAFAEARVPCLTVVLRKAFGGGYIAMNSRALSADLALAWPGAQIGVMGARQAVGIVHSRELAAAGDGRAAETDRLEAAYAEEHLSADVAARDGHVDEVIRPQDTRERLCWALRTIGEGRGRGDHGNIPL